MEITNIKYGIIAIDKRQIDSTTGDEMVDIIHFCGYEKEPTIEQYKDLYRELGEDEAFGLTEIIEFIELAPAPEDIVEHFRESLINNSENKTV